MSLLAPSRRRRTPREETPRPAQPPADLGPSFDVITTALTMIGLLAGWVLLQTAVLGGVAQARDQHLLYDDFREQLAAATAPTGPVIAPGDPVAVITIPALGLEQVVVEGTSPADLRSGPGHRRDTVLPGQEGVSTVYGRASAYGGPFAQIGDLPAGQRIVAQTAQGRFEFTVIGVRRDGDPLPAPAEAGHARLVLVSAEGSGRLAGLRPTRTVYVDAETDAAVPFPAGRPTAVPDSELAMARDDGALPPLAVALAGLALLSVAVTAARQRWAAGLVWVLAAPVALALAWMTTDTAVRLLPNLL